MPREKLQSAIKDCRDQLFLDTATGSFLNVVGANLGLDRPIFGVDDDHWRLVVKNVALQPKSIIKIIHKTLEAYLGPKTSQIGALTVPAAAGDKIITINATSGITQVGTLTLDPGTATEETVDFCYRDFTTNQVYLNSPLLFSHTPGVTGASLLTTEAGDPAGSTNFWLEPNQVLPSAGVPYPVIIGRGTAHEELAQLTAITHYYYASFAEIAVPTAFSHKGYKVGSIHTTVAEDSPAGRMYIKLNNPSGYTDGIARVLPSVGMLIPSDTGEPVMYDSSDYTTSTFFLKYPLFMSYAAGDPIDPATATSSMEVCSIIQRGVGWDVFETEEGKIKVYLPASLFVLKKQDAAWAHGVVPSAASTVTTGALAATDTTIPVSSTSSFPSPTGMISIDGTINRFYTNKDASNFYITQPVGSIVGSGAGVSLIRVPYSGISLEDGNWLPASAGGPYQANHFPGPYTYSPQDRGVSIALSTLKHTTGLHGRSIPPPLSVLHAQKASFSTLEVSIFAIAWSGIHAPETVMVGSGTGYAEEIEYRGLHLKSVASTTLSSSYLVGVSALAAVSTTGFPTSDAFSSGAGYRIIVGAGTANEEIVTVLSNSASTFTLTEPTTSPHNSGETVRLVSDVLSVGPLVQPHAVGHSVHQVLQYITVVDGSSFPDTGTVIVNHGNTATYARNYVSSTPPDSSWLYLRSSSKFPTTIAPFAVVVAEGATNEQCHVATANNLSGNKLAGTTFLTYTINTGDAVVFYGAGESVLSYIGKQDNVDDPAYTDLLLPEGTICDYAHPQGTPVIYTPGYGNPLGTGEDFPFYVPPDPAGSMRNMIDLVKAAGVEVVFLNDR